MMPNVMLRLDVEAMKYSILHAFMSHSSECEKAIGESVDRVMREFDFEAVVKAEVDRVMKRAVVDAIASAVAKMTWQPEIAALFERGASKKMRQALESVLRED